MIVYKAKNTVDGKEYIGKTKRTLNGRMSEHFSRTNKNFNYPFYNALRKYGIENFEWEVIVDCFDSENLLNNAEKFFIDRYNTKVPNGYNLTDGGEGITNPSEETRRKISVSQKGKILSEETKQKLRLCHLGKPSTKKGISSPGIMGENNPMYGIRRYGKDNPMYGKKRPDNIERNKRQDMREKISKGLEGRFMSKQTRDKIRESLITFNREKI